MPKINNGGPSYYGHEGLAKDAEGRLHNVDPSRDVDGKVVDGYESEDRPLDDVDVFPGEPTLRREQEHEDAAGTADKPLDEREQRDAGEKSEPEGEKPSAGSSSRSSRSSSASVTEKSSKSPR